MTGVQFNWATGASFCCFISSSFIFKDVYFLPYLWISCTLPQIVIRPHALLTPSLGGE